MEATSQVLPSQNARSTSKDDGRPKTLQSNVRRGKVSTSDLKAPANDPKKTNTEPALPPLKEVDKSKEKSGAKVAKPSASNVPPKATWKVVVRKLPPSREFAREQFEDFVKKVCQELRILPSVFTVDHFIDGKISRKRGPINGAGFITFQDEMAFQSFLANCVAQASSVFEDTLGQIEVTAAPYPRTFRQKVDKNENTYENDPEFLAFQERLKKGDAPDATRSVVESDTLSVADKMKSNPLLSYLRDRAIEKAQRRRGFNPVDERSSRKKEKKDKKEKEKLSRKERKKLKIMKKASSSLSADASSGSKSGTGSGKGSKDYGKRPATSGNHVPSDSPAAASILQKGTVQKQNEQRKTGGQGGPHKQQPQQQPRKDNANSKPTASHAAPGDSAANAAAAVGPHAKPEYRNSGGRGGGGGRSRGGGGGRGDHNESSYQPPQGVKVLRKDNTNPGASANS